MAAIDVDLQHLVAQTRRGPRRPGAAASPENDGWAWHHPLRFCDVVRRDRLGDVAVATLGIHNLRFPVRCRAADFVDVADDLRGRAARANAGLRRGAETALPTRPRHTAGGF